MLRPHQMKRGNDSRAQMPYFLCHQDRWKEEFTRALHLCSTIVKRECNWSTQKTWSKNSLWLGSTVLSSSLPWITILMSLVIYLDVNPLLFLEHTIWFCEFVYFTIFSLCLTVSYPNHRILKCQCLKCQCQCHHTIWLWPHKALAYYESLVIKHLFRSPTEILKTLTLGWFWICFTKGKLWSRLCFFCTWFRALSEIISTTPH